MSTHNEQDVSKFLDDAASPASPASKRSVEDWSSDEESDVAKRPGHRPPKRSKAFRVIERDRAQTPGPAVMTFRQEDMSLRGPATPGGRSVKSGIRSSAPSPEVIPNIGRRIVKPPPSQLKKTTRNTLPKPMQNAGDDEPEDDDDEDDLVLLYPGEDELLEVQRSGSVEVEHEGEPRREPKSVTSRRKTVRFESEPRTGMSGMAPGRSRLNRSQKHDHQTDNTSDDSDIIFLSRKIPCPPAPPPPPPSRRKFTFDLDIHDPLLMSEEENHQLRDLVFILSTENTALQRSKAELERKVAMLERDLENSTASMSEMAAMLGKETRETARLVEANVRLRRHVELIIKDERAESSAPPSPSGGDITGVLQGDRVVKGPGRPQPGSSSMVEPIIRTS